MDQQPTPSNQLTQEDFNRLHEKAKGIDNGWCAEIVKRVNPKIENDDRFKKYFRLHEKKIYNIFNGVVSNKVWRAFIYKEVDDWIREQQNDIKQIKQEAEG